MARDGWNRTFFEHLRNHSGRATAAPTSCRHCGQDACPCGQEEAQRAVAAVRALSLPRGTSYAEKVSAQVTRAIPAGPTYSRWPINNLRACVDDVVAIYRAGGRLDDPHAMAAQTASDLLTTAFNALP
jgi:hypothetical protein